MNFSADISLERLLSVSPADGKGVFVRITSYEAETEGFMVKYLALTGECGAAAENGLANPSADSIARCAKYAEGFAPSREFILRAVSARVRIAPGRAQAFSQRTAEIFSDLKTKGKNDSMLKNIFLKFLCWLGDLSAAFAPSDKRAKLLCSGVSSLHEILFLSAAVASGADVVLIDTQGEEHYRKYDTQGDMSICISSGNTPFPADFSVNKLISGAKESREIKSLAAGNSDIKFCTNAWLTGDIFSDILKPPAERGGGDIIYNLFVRINGVEDKTSYLRDIYGVYAKLSEARPVLVIDGKIEPPSNEEIAAVSRGNYRDVSGLVNDLSKNIVHADKKLQDVIKDAFSFAAAEYFSVSKDLRKTLTKSVYLLCWLKRYQHCIFGKKGQGCVIFYGGCGSENEALFMRMLARCPADVLILAPDLSKKCCLSDELLYERNFTQSLPAEKFPKEEDIRMGTVAYYAERELDTVMYSDSGLYRNFQYSKANALTLRTMCEEVPMLWGEELKYRPNFSVSGGEVNMPVIMAKISGVKNRDLNGYWDMIGEMCAAESTIVIKGEPMVPEELPCEYTVGFMQGGRLRKDAVKNHKLYKYGFLKEDMQDHILDKLSLLLRSGIIKDQKVSGYEFRMAAICLNMDERILRLLQSFDFTKRNPKLVYISTTERIISRDDAVLLAYLNLLGFDIAYFVPTGYQGAEKYYEKNLMECHEAGEYMFDLQIPDLTKRAQSKEKGFFGKLFGKK